MQGKPDDWRKTTISEHYYTEDDGSPKPFGERPLMITRLMTADEIEKVYGVRVVKASTTEEKYD